MLHPNMVINATHLWGVGVEAALQEEMLLGLSAARHYLKPLCKYLSSTSTVE